MLLKNQYLTLFFYGTVYHDAGYFQSYSSFSRLRDGVALLQVFHDLMPNHHVVSVFMDLKGGLGSEGHTAEDYDAIIRQLPLYTPADAQGNASSIQEGIDLYGWPEVEDMRGKFLWVLTHGQDDYCNPEDCVNRKAFVAQVAADHTDIGNKPHSVFYNQPIAGFKEGDIPIGPAIYQAGYIGRAWHSSDLDTEEKWNMAISQQYQHITTDKINYHVHTFSKTHNKYGYPFQTLNGVDVSEFPGDDEGASVMYLNANKKGDLWGRRDGIHFAYKKNENATFFETYEWQEYTSVVSLVNSHCKEFAKAGLMVREEDSRFPLGSGQYFAIIRTCGHVMRVQYRERDYLLTVSKLIPPIQRGQEVSKRMVVKLRYRYDGKDSIVQGWFMEGVFNINDSDVDLKEESPRIEEQDAGFVEVDDNVTTIGARRWTLIHQQKFPGIKMTAHGLVASSHYSDGNDDGTPYRALFVDTRTNNETVTAADFPHLFAPDNRGENSDVFGDGYGLESRIRYD